VQPTHRCAACTPPRSQSANHATGDNDSTDPPPCHVQRHRLAMRATPRSALADHRPTHSPLPLVGPTTRSTRSDSDTPAPADESSPTTLNKGCDSHHGSGIVPRHHPAPAKSPSPPAKHSPSPSGPTAPPKPNPTTRSNQNPPPTESANSSPSTSTTEQNRDQTACTVVELLT
jgi:hypothetical protein